MPALKRILIGKPISSEEEAHQRIRKLVALPVFASDAISSTAYATDEILVVLLLQAGIGATAFNLLTPIAVVVCVLLVIVVMSYRQTIHAYPSGGGAYIVSRENLGDTPSLVAGSSLLVDYILTVAVSVAGGVLAIRTAFGFSTAWTVPICLACILLMTVVNLRGVKESGAAFAGPTYFYVIMLLILLGTGFYRVFVQHVPPIPDSMLSEEAIAASRLTAASACTCWPGVLVRCRRALGCRGGVERRTSVQDAREQERRAHPGGDGCDPGLVLPRSVGPGFSPQAVPRRA